MQKNSQQIVGVKSKKHFIVFCGRQLFSYLPNLFMEIFFPKKCVGCGKFGQLVCFSCAQKIEKLKTLVCIECGKISRSGKYCPNCKKKAGASADGIIVAAKYNEGPIKEMIHRLKYDGLLGLSDLIGEVLLERIVTISLPKNTIITPVPMHKSKEKRRGFNQAVLIARYLSERANIVYAELLVRTKQNHAQVGFNRRKRLANVRNSFEIAENVGISGKNIILIDDVITTGATINECAKILKLAGANKVYALAVARNI